MKLAVSLILVLALLFGAVYGIKRLGVLVKNPKSNQWIQVVSQHYLDPKHYLLVVQSQQQMFLLGISPQGMHLLTPLDSKSEGPSLKSAPR